MKQHLIERMLYVALALAFIGMAIVGYVSIKAYEEFTRQQEVLQQQVAGQKEVLEGMQELLANQGKTTDDVNKSLSCILIFFSKPDRANFYISDLATCTLTNTDTGRTEILPLRPTPSTPDTTADAQSPPPAQETPTQPAAPHIPVPDGNTRINSGILDLYLKLPTNILRSLL